MTGGKIYMFADGPNYFKSAQPSFRVNFGKLRDYLEKNGVGEIKRFLWYDIDPQILGIDFERAPVPKLKGLEKKAEELGKSTTELLEELCATNPESFKEITKELLGFRKAILLTQQNYEGREKFLGYIEHVAEVFLKEGRSFRYSRNCHNCGEEVLFVGKTEAGATDFNLATDLIYYGAKNAYDSAILISGDGGYTKPVKYIQDLGKSVMVIFFESSTNPELRTQSDDFLSLESIKKFTEHTA